MFGPKKYVALDSQNRTDTPYFRRYVGSRGLGGRVKTYWNTDQTDKAALLRIVETEFDGLVDLVINDASHLYGPTRTSFEALFPLLMPGGLYIVEDWAWGHWLTFFSWNHPWAREDPLTRLVVELIEAAATLTQLILSVVVYQDFVVIERGPRQLDKVKHLNLDDYIMRRPLTALFLQFAIQLRRKLRWSCVNDMLTAKKKR